MKNLLPSSSLVAFLLGLMSVWQPSELSGQSEPHRLAWLVANANYESQPLKNPHNDIKMIQDSLESIGFEVKSDFDLANVSEFQAAARATMSLLLERQASEFIFYYSGHGIQVDGENYLMPTQVQIQDEFEVPTSCYSVTGDLMRRTAALDSCASIIVLDACRINPFEAGRYRSFASGKGLAKLNCPKGCLMAYSTEPGKVAEDGDGGASVYAAAFARNIKREGEEIQAVLNAVQREVIIGTDERQFPVYESKLTVPVILNPKGVLTQAEIADKLNSIESKLKGMSQTDILDNAFLSGLEDQADVLLENAPQMVNDEVSFQKTLVLNALLLLMRSEWLAWEDLKDQGQCGLEVRVNAVLEMMDSSPYEPAVVRQELLSRLELNRLERLAVGADLEEKAVSQYITSFSNSASAEPEMIFRVLSLMSKASQAQMDCGLCGASGAEIASSIRQLDKGGKTIFLIEEAGVYEQQLDWLKSMPFVRSAQFIVDYDYWCNYQPDFDNDLFEHYSSFNGCDGLCESRPEYYASMFIQYSYLMDLTGVEKTSKREMKEVLQREIDLAHLVVAYLETQITDDWDDWFGGVSRIRLASQRFLRTYQVFDWPKEAGELELSAWYAQEMSPLWRRVLKWQVAQGIPGSVELYRQLYDRDLELVMDYSGEEFMNSILDNWAEFMEGHMANPDLSELPIQMAVAPVVIQLSDSTSLDVLHKSEMLTRTVPGGWLSKDYIFAIIAKAKFDGLYVDVLKAISHVEELWEALNDVGANELGSTVGYRGDLSSTDLFHFYLNMVDRLSADLNIGQHGVEDNVQVLLNDIIKEYDAWSAGYFLNPYLMMRTAARSCDRNVTSREFLDRYVVSDDGLNLLCDNWLDLEIIKSMHSRFVDQEETFELVVQNLGVLLALELARGNRTKEELASALRDIVTWAGSQEIDARIYHVYLGLANLNYYLEEMTPTELGELNESELCFWQEFSCSLMEEWLRSEVYFDDFPAEREWYVLDDRMRKCFKHFDICSYDVAGLLGDIEAFEIKYGLDLDEPNEDLMIESTLWYHKAELHKDLGNWEEARFCFEELLRTEQDSVNALQFSQDAVTLSIQLEGLEATQSAAVYAGHFNFDLEDVRFSADSSVLYYSDDDGIWPVVCGVNGADTTYAVRSSGAWAMLNPEAMLAATRLSWKPNAEPTLGYVQMELDDYLQDRGGLVWTCGSPVIQGGELVGFSEDLRQLPFEKILGVGQLIEVEETTHTQALRYLYVH